MRRNDQTMMILCLRRFHAHAAANILFTNHTTEIFMKSFADLSSSREFTDVTNAIIEVGLAAQH